MTPCEKIGLKVGDEIRLTKKGALYSGMNIEESIILDRDDGTDSPYFRSKDSRFLVCLLIDGFGTEEGWFEMTKTEAEKRGAKFGAMGVVKATGERVVFSVENRCSGTWEVLAEGKFQAHIVKPYEIRLDHEPEFKEIPFRDATHEQRMISENIQDEWGQGTLDIFWSEKEEIYVILLRSGGTDTTTSTSSRYTVRIPA